MRRRHRVNKGQRTHRLSSLLRCAEHGRALYIHKVRKYLYWYCPASEMGHWHLRVRDTDVLQSVCDRLVSDLMALGSDLELPPDPDKTAGLAAAQHELVQRRERLTDALEAGSLDATVYAGRVEGIETQLRTLQTELSDAEAWKERQQDRRSGLEELAAVIRDTPDAITQADPQLVNMQLRSLIDYVLVSDAGIEIRYR
jgi:hypothetical protein